MFNRMASSDMILICIAFMLLCCTSGCFNKTVYIPDGKAVRLRQDIKSKVWVMDASGKVVPGTMMLKDGWYVLADQKGKEK